MQFSGSYNLQPEHTASVALEDNPLTYVVVTCNRD